jgi:hypothetical protein
VNQKVYRQRAEKAFVGGMMGVDGSRPPGLKVNRVRISMTLSSVSLEVEYKVDGETHTTQRSAPYKNDIRDSAQLSRAYVDLARALGAAARTNWRKK